MLNEFLEKVIAERVDHQKHKMLLDFGEYLFRHLGNTEVNCILKQTTAVLLFRHGDHLSAYGGDCQSSCINVSKRTGRIQAS